MTRIKLKCGGKKRPKAGFGIDGAVMAAATLTAAGITSAATAASAKKQADAMVSNAKTQAEAINRQNENNNRLQETSINFTREQNERNRQQQQDIQTTLQMLAGQQNTNDAMEANKAQLKYGGKRNRNKLKSTPFYGGALPFEITDGGGAIPVSVDGNGYGVYELYGNDHDHYHKTSNGKYKSGVGVKLANGNVVEGEGNQNTNQGELMYVTPDDVKFISKHSIKGFNPAKAVMSGVHPEEAFAAQEAIKFNEGYKDDGTKVKKRSSLKAKLGAYNVLLDAANLTQNPANNTGNVAAGTVYAIANQIKNSSPVAKYGTRRRLKAKDGFWDTYSGSVYNGIGNLGGALVTSFGNILSSNRLAKANMKAGQMIANAYQNLKTIDPNSIKFQDFEAPHTLAVVRSPNTNINPQLERVRRNSAAEIRDINRNTLSDAARQQRIAGVNDRMLQRQAELYANKANADEQIKQGNAERITQTAQANADRDVQARRDYTGHYLDLLKYNNDIENEKITGSTEALANASINAQSLRSAAWQNSATAFGNAIAATGNAFSDAYLADRKMKQEQEMYNIGLADSQKTPAAIKSNDPTQMETRLAELRYQLSRATDERTRDYIMKQITLLEEQLKS